MNAGPIPSRAFPRDLVGHLRELAALRPNDTALIVVGADGDRAFDYAALDRRVRALAAALQERCAPGERALLLLDSDEHYVVGFFACLYAGLIAVPAFPPESARERHLARLAAIAADSGARCVLATRGMIESLGAGLEAFAGAAALAADGPEAEPGAWRPHSPRLEDIAFLQYTSGSTASPKGVMISHGNLMANERAIEEGLSIGPDDVFVNWLPLYHDMGLIGGLLQPIHRGIPVVLMNPGFFLERPLRWLEAISRHRGTISGGPDFAYRLCLERVKDGQLRGLDLSSWRVAFSGAEPVRRDTLDAFAARCAPAGFAADAIYPCYGLAEATLFVTGGRRGAGMAADTFAAESLARGSGVAAGQGRTLVGCGTAPSGHRVEIVDPDTLAGLPDGRIGEIWAGGPSIGQGYWRRARETAETFVERDGRRWLRTGDLGFLHEGRLYIAGRIKDLIIVRGRNLYPQDIECAVEDQVEVVRKGRVAAFAVETDAGEGIGVAVEVSRGLQKLVSAEALVAALGEAVGAVCREPLEVAVLLNPGALPKTSSGKLQRAACRRGWREGGLDAYAVSEHGRFVQGDPAAPPPTLPESETETALAAIWEAVLNRGGLGRDAHFFANGGNSLAAAQVAARIGDRWDVEFPARGLFEHPRLAECAAAIGRLVAAGDRRRGPAIVPLPAERRAGPLPLSPAQQRLWFLWRLEPAGTAYHIGGARRFAGRLDAAALDAAWAGLARRHESLRTVFGPGADGLGEQSVLAEAKPGLALIDLRATPAPEREARAAEEARRIEAVPFDLTAGPPLRVALIRVGDEDHILVVAMHHIISDGASMQVLIDELALRYRALAAGEPLRLPDLPIQYADYAAWQRDRLSSTERERHLAYWRRRLGGDHPVLALPTDRARPAANDRAGRHGLEVPAELAAELRRFADSRSATLFMALLAGFQVLLYRYTGQNDIRIGVPFGNRRRTETEGVVGFFVNTQVLSGRLDGRTALATVLDRAREAMLEAEAHQDLPFEQLVEALRPDRSLGHNPLFQVMANHLREDRRALDWLPGLTSAEYPLVGGSAQVELALDTRELPDGRLTAAFTYAAELFEGGTIERLAQHYLAVLRSLVRHPERTAGGVELLAPAERERLRRWGRHGHDGFSPVPLPVHALIERQAEARPDAPALIFGGAELSRGELNRRANRLAHRLIALGVGPEFRVGIAVERSVEMVVGLLAVLKAGGAYLPLDPDHPPERLAGLMADGGIGLLLTQARPGERIPRREGIGVLDLDRDRMDSEPEHNPDVRLHGHNLAYVIHTSGSTGRPKGVAVAHGPLSMHVQAIGERYGMTPEDRELQFASIGFDGAHERLLVPLAFGAAVMPRDGELWPVDRACREIAAHRITVACFTPGYLGQLAEVMGERARGLPIRSYTSGGEALPRAVFDRVRETLAPPRILNGYGPTETVITPLLASAGPDTRFDSAYMPIGRPVGDRAAYILDIDLNPVPQGVAGELYLGGAGLARGYLDRPGLTAERFVADPFDPAGGRLYRTGDQARWLPDGQVEYLGRIDHQVKIRGFRVELGEIEARLLAQPGVREAAAAALPGTDGPRLAAYVVPREGAGPDPAAIRSALAEALPDYMVPDAVMVLAGLPLSPNGKVDRAALPRPELRAEEYEPPRDEAEAALAALWAEVLGLERVGRHDDFFDLGGHSLAAIRLVALLAQRHALELPVRRLFDQPTLCALAATLPRESFADAGAKARRLARMDLLLSECEI
jgi:amino acid adenylation domain-containing protein